MIARGFSKIRVNYGQKNQLCPKDESIMAKRVNYGQCVYTGLVSLLFLSVYMSALAVFCCFPSGFV